MATDTGEKKKLFHLLDRYKKNRIFPKELQVTAAHSTMLFRPSMATDLEKAECLGGAKLIYSLWEGYLKKEPISRLLNWLQDHGIPMIEIHTSGHASISDLQRLANAINAKMVVPVHSYESERFPEFFKRVELKQDGIWWDIK